MKKLKTYFLRKSILCLMLLFALFGCTVTSVSATSRTPDEAINWVKSKVGQYLDMDGAYGAQCVDLILAYYDYLGVARSSGNGADYAWNTLPAGWSRVQGGQPQKGDILVYGASSGNPYGHVAIYESDYSTYHQNFDSSPVRQVTYYYNGLSNPYWGYIRPNWSSPINPAWENTTGSITETNATISTTVTMPYQGHFTLAGGSLYNESGQLLKQMTENVSYNSSYMKVWYDIQAEMGITLSPGTTYKYQFRAVFNGTQYTGPMLSFKTAGTAPVTPVVASKKAQPMKVSVKQGSVSFILLKFANQTIKKASVFSVKNAQGTVTFTKVSGSGKLLISKSGVITVKKKASKGTYSMKVKVTAAGNSQYKAGSKTVTVKVKVK